MRGGAERRWRCEGGGWVRRIGSLTVSRGCIFRKGDGMGQALDFRFRFSIHS